MRKLAVCIGINNYPGELNDLNGCVNDANDWYNLLKDSFNFENIKLLLEDNATKEKVLFEIENLVSQLESSDVGVITFSGHGTWVIDDDNDESDNRDEAICVHDGIILDDEIRSIFRKIKKESKLTFISDSCHSGSVTRAMLFKDIHHVKFSSGIDWSMIPKFMPPSNDAISERLYNLPVKKRFIYPEEAMNEILLTGCNSTESSFDAKLNGRYNGVLTALAIDIIKSSNKHLTYNELFEEIRKILPNRRFQQSPQLEGKAEFKNSLIFN